LQPAESNHYAALGLDRRCTAEQIRAAYRVLAKQNHPDLNPTSSAASARTQTLNAAYEILSDPEQRAAYDRELNAPKQPAGKTRAGKFQQNISQDIHLRLEDFLRGTQCDVRVKDPANPNGAEIYQLVIPPETSPGTLFRLPRIGPFASGQVKLRVKASPNFRFKVRGSDLRCDLKIKPERAAQGGMEMIRGLTGAMLRVPIPRGVGRDQIIRLSGEGLPKARGGRGDLLVRINYRVEVRVSRAAGR
jgi:curved DNA-binding protein